MRENPWNTQLGKHEATLEEFSDDLNQFTKIDRTLKLSKRKTENKTPLKYDVTGNEDVDTKLLKEEFNNTDYVLQDLFDVIGDSPGYSAHSSLKNTNSVSKKTRDTLTLFLDKYLLSIMVDITMAEKLSSGDKVLVIVDKEKLTDDMTTLDIQI